MTIDKVRQLQGAEPFQPFIICLIDGREVSVTDPFFMGIAPSERRLIVGGPGDAFEFIDLSLVTDLKVKPTKSNRPKRRQASGE